MGAIAGILSGVGGELQRENIAAEKARQTANEEMAQLLEHNADLAKIFRDGCPNQAWNRRIYGAVWA